MYESDDDREGERKVAALMGGWWGCKLLPLPRFALADYVAVRDDDGVWAFVEVKRRRVAHDHYDTYMLSAKKVDGLIELANKLHLEAYVAVEFTDGVYTLDAHTISRGYLRHGGRADRPNDPNALENTYHIGCHFLIRVGNVT
jgi:hypothetical protein